MVTPSLPEQITESFYAWELRGRGWQTADYAVALEPPFRPCRLLPQFARHALLPLDDGKRPTLLSSFVDRARDLLVGSEASATVEIPEFEEEAPHPACERDAPTTLRIQVARDYASNSDVAMRLLGALSASLQPVSVEFCGYAGSVAMQIACAPEDREHVVASLEGYVSEVSVVEQADLLAERWQEDGESIVVDFGLSDEFFLPLNTFGSFRIDPHIALVAALSRATSDEFVCFQILFERARNPWGEAIAHAIIDGDGKSVFADAPEFVPLSKEKSRSPFFSVVARVAAQARSRARAFELARGTSPFVLQFARPGSNELIPLENSGYPESAHAGCVLTRESWRTGMLLSADELVGLVHVPDASVRHPALVREEKRTKALPSEAVGHALVLGENVHRGARALMTVSDEARLQHMHVIGASGTGKSTLLVQLITQDIERGNGVAVLDPHGDLIDDVLGRVPDARMRDVVVFDPADEEWPVGLNVLAASSTLEKQLLSSDLVSVFQRLSTSWGDTMGAVLSNAVLAVLESERGGTLIDLRRFLVDEAFRKQFLKTVTDEEVQFFWTKGFPLIGARSIGPIITRLDAFLRPKLIRHIVGQRAPRLDVASVLSEGKILLAKLSQGLIGQENASLLGSLLAMRFHQLALARQQIIRSARRPFFLYADEAQHFVTPSMASLLTDVRKYRLGLVLAHQNLFQLRGSPVESALLGNAYTRIAFRVGDDDAKKLAEGCSFFEARDFRNLGRAEAIVRFGVADHDCSLRTLQLEDVDPSTAEARRSAVVDASRQAFAVPLAEVKQRLSEAYETSGTASGAAAVAPAPVERASADSHPATTATLQADQETPLVAPSARKAPSPAPPLPSLGRGGQEHKYLQHLIKRLAEERGFRGVIEQPVNDGQIDVVLTRDGLAIAVEVSISTDTSHEVENVRKCLAAGYTHVALICPEARRRQKCQRALDEHSLAGNVRVLGPDDLVSYLDEFEEPLPPPETTVRGYKVRVSRQQFSPDELAARRTAVAQVIARSVGKARKD